MTCYEDLIFHVMIFSANCGPPVQPPNGYTLPYSSTIEGAMVSLLCWSYDQQSIRMEENLSCSHYGVWEPNPREVCGTNSDLRVTGTDNNTIYKIKYCMCHIRVIFSGGRAYPPPPGKREGKEREKERERERERERGRRGESVYMF